MMTKQATWQLPSEMKVIDVLVEAELLDDTHLLLVSENYAGVVLLEPSIDDPPNPLGQDVYKPAQILIDAESEAGFSALDVGSSATLE